LHAQGTPVREPGRGRRRGLAPRQRGALLLLATVAVAALAIVLFAAGGTPASERLALDFVKAWQRRDYATMYEDSSAATRARLSPSTFAAAYQNALDMATATSSRIGRPTLGAGTVNVTVVVRTRIFGALPLRWVLPVTGGGRAPHINWNPSLTFPGLRAGETLTRRSTLPPRAELLAADGTPLAGVSGASDIIGTLGPAPPSRAEQLLAAGYPPGATVGLNGLELVFERRLAGTPGGELLAGSRLIASATPRAEPPLRTTIIPSLESLAVATLGAQQGGLVVLAPSTGDVLAVAGTPFSELQPPGSTFKIVTLTGVLFARLATPSTVFPYATEATIDGYTLHNANGENCGGTLGNAFAVSCNSVFAPLGAKLGAARLLDAARRFGFNQQPSIPIVAESTIPPRSLQSDLDVGSSAIGQGEVLSTALQMAVVAATIADTGRRPTPTLTSELRRPLIRVLPAHVARMVRQLMLGVVQYGTGTAAQISGVPVAGKTGTAELATTVGNCTPAPGNACPGAQQNNPRNTDAWFVAFAPAIHHPRVVVGVLLPHNGAGGATAAPLAAVLLRAGLLATAGHPTQ
jgi:hypothetical protein